VKSHAAVAAVLLGSEELVQNVLDDIDSSALTDAEKLLLHFLDKVNHDSPRITPADVEPLHAAGWTDEQIWYGITVCALFNFYNRWIDATGVCALSDEAHREGGKRSAAGSYARK
jgi:alkylhydroperoxidase family enzyme